MHLDWHQIATQRNSVFAKHMMHVKDVNRAVTSTGSLRLEWRVSFLCGLMALAACFRPKFTNRKVARPCRQPAMCCKSEASVMTCHDKCSTLNSCESALPYLPWQDLLGLVPCPSARSLSRSCCKMPAGFHGCFKCLYIWNAWYVVTTSQISQFTALFQTSKPVNFEVSSDCTNLFGCRMCTL